MRIEKRESQKLGFLFYELLYGPIVFFHSVYRQLIILLLMFGLGAGIFSYFERLAPLDALLASVSTITTIGLYVPHGGNFTTLPPQEALLLIVLIIVSVGAGASILQGTVNSAVNGDLARGAVEKRLISKLRNHAIVYGYTEVGKYVIAKLDEMGFDYVIVTDDKSQHEKLVQNHKLTVLERNKETIEALNEAAIDRASVVIVCLSNDPDSMLTILSARKLRPGIRIVSTINNAGHVESAKNAGADHVISSSITVGHLLAFSAVTPDLIGVIFSDTIGAKEISEVRVREGSPLVGRMLSSINVKGLSIVGAIGHGKLHSGSSEPNFVIQPGDSLLALADSKSLQLLEDTADARVNPHEASTET